MDSKYDEKPKRKERFPCPICGDLSFDWGILPYNYFDTYGVGFVSDAVERGRWTKQCRDQDIKRIKARHCLTCGNVQLFANPD